MHKEKVYRVEFMSYTNPSKDTVHDIENDAYLCVGKDPFLIKESDLDTYRKYGEGFKELVFVGYIEV